MTTYKHTVKDECAVTVSKCDTVLSLCKITDECHFISILALYCVGKINITCHTVKSHNCPCINSVRGFVAVIGFTENYGQIIVSVFFYGEINGYAVTIVLKSANHTLQFACCGISTVISVSVTLADTVFKLVSYRQVIVIKICLAILGRGNCNVVNGSFIGIFNIHTKFT